MASPNRLMIAALFLALSGGAAFAQTDEEKSFYADPVLPDPVPVTHPLYRPADATATVAAVAPALERPAAATKSAACSARNPCAVIAPAAPG